MQITFEGWHEPPGGEDARRRCPTFRVTADGDDAGPSIFVWVFLSRTALSILGRQLELDDGSEDNDARIDRAMCIYGVRVVEDNMLSGAWALPAQGQQTQQLVISSDDLDDITAMLAEKVCDYQEVEGRDLYCSAAATNDGERVGSIGLRTVAPTSRSTCAACSMPDTRILCSNLHHPAVVATVLSVGSVSRDLWSAMCDIGSPAIAQASACHAGGNECWVRVLEPDAARAVAERPPEALAEALDHLDTAWRLEFGKRPGLLRLRSATAIVDLAAGCTSREEFESRISTISDIVKQLDIPDALLADGDPISGDQTVRRLKSALGKRLDADANAEADSALNVLAAAAGLRRGAQHTAARAESAAAFAQFDIRYPPRDWGDAWNAVRSRATQALETLARLLRDRSVQE